MNEQPYSVCANGVIHARGCGERSYSKAGGVLAAYDTIAEALDMARAEEVSSHIRVAPCARKVAQAAAHAAYTKALGGEAAGLLYVERLALWRVYEEARNDEVAK